MLEYSPNDVIDQNYGEAGSSTRISLLPDEYDEDRAEVYSRENDVMRRLLFHPRFEVDTERMENCETENGNIGGLYGHIPIGCLSLSFDSRDDNDHSSVVMPDALD